MSVYLMGEILRPFSHTPVTRYCTINKVAQRESHLQLSSRPKELFTYICMVEETQILHYIDLSLIVNLLHFILPTVFPEMISNHLSLISLLYANLRDDFSSR